jgi:hypothetical protein
MSYAFPDTDFDRAGSHEAPVHFEGDVAFCNARESITSEPELDGAHHDPRFPDNDWLGAVNMGGGAVPADFEWRSNPRGDRLPRREKN